MKQRRLLVAMVFIVSGSLFPGCSRQHYDDCDKSDAAVTAPLQKIIERDNAKDIEGVLFHYSDDITFLPPNGDVVNGKAAVRARYERLFANFNPDLRSETTEVFSSSDVAYVRGYTRGRLTPVGGGEPTKLDDKFLAILKCRGGTWRVSHLMWSPANQAS
jgi:ketosteroid isomerase-like protein